MRTLLIILALTIGLPFTLTAQNTLLLEENNLSGVEGVPQTFYFTVEYDVLQINASGQSGNVNITVLPVTDTSDTGTLGEYYQNGGSLTAYNIPPGAYKAVVTSTSSYSGVDFSIYEIGTSTISPFFYGETFISNGVYYLAFPSGNFFGYYSFLTEPNYIYHFDLGYEYVFDANDGKSGVYFYDFTSNDFFYTSPTFPFPYLYDFGLNSVVYYYPDPDQADDPGRYNTDGIRYFYVFNTGEIITK